MKRYSDKDIRDYLASGQDKTDWKSINKMTESQIEKAALEDNRLHGADDDWYVDSIAVRGVGDYLRRTQVNDYMPRVGIIVESSSGITDYDLRLDSINVSNPIFLKAIVEVSSYHND